MADNIKLFKRVLADLKKVEAVVDETFCDSATPDKEAQALLEQIMQVCIRIPAGFEDYIENS